MSQEPWSDASRGVTITIKYGKGYEETWAVFRGRPDEVRDDILTFFGIDRESVAEQTLSDVVVTATSIAHGKGNVARYLGGNVISSGPAQQSSGSTGSAAWAEAEQEQGSRPTEDVQLPERHWILGAIEGASSLEELKSLYVENKADFDSVAELLPAWKAKGKALKEAAQ